MTTSTLEPGLYLASCKIASDAFKLIPCDSMRRYGVVPIEVQDGKLLVAMANPADVSAMDHLRVLTGYDIDVLKVPKEAVVEFLNHKIGDGAEHPVCRELVEVSTSVRKDDSDNAESHVIKTVDTLIRLALKRRASDIHLEPQKEGLFVRFRIDGTLKTVHEFPKLLQPSLLSRIKILANLNITEKRTPQDGQINFHCEGKDIDLRVSTLPAKYGEKVVIRILDKSSLAVGFESLGFDAGLQGLFESLIDRPHGLFLVTGPTGSGKTTTLYSVIQRLKSPLKNIITLEDPIEYELLANSSSEAGVTQVQVNPKVGLTFAAGLRSALRQDPDVIMVGEIRDKETAEIAMKSAMTGHLVMSTLHTNDAPSTLGRLKDMGIEPYMISSTVIGVLAQRLVRVLCPQCKEAYRPPARSLKTFFPGREDLSNVSLFRAIGCDQCQGSGYLGRRGIFELLLMTDELKAAINSGASSEQFRQVALTQGLKTLRSSGLDLVFKGFTTVEEVFRSTVA